MIICDSIIKWYITIKNTDENDEFTCLSLATLCKISWGI